MNHIGVANLLASGPEIITFFGWYLVTEMSVILVMALKVPKETSICFCQSNSCYNRCKLLQY